ncbi:MAG: flagellar export chaperone FlgN [Candidatus Hydrogenedentes bacterium]|nr:flagellar export chaperone FlgN [Candidatus Hydrogenedentota bacterium]
MNDLFTRLCEDLDNEVERQETLLAVCRAQLDALNTRNLAAIEARTAALDILVRETAHAAAARTVSISAVARELVLPPEQRTLSGLIALTSKPWSERLLHAQTRLKRVLNESRRVVRMNAHMLRRSLDLNQRLLACVALGPNPDPAYSERGIFSAIAETPARIDQKG